jgi:3-deoxy-D-manno-octulosonate 8-phosphate phosphatase KdsC-like HAD superfamily phosphatase
VSEIPGGKGAVRDFIEIVLKRHSKWWIIKNIRKIIYLKGSKLAIL